MKVKVMPATCALGRVPFHGKYHYRKTKIEHIFALAFTISEILAFIIFDLENLDHGRALEKNFLALLQRLNAIQNRV